MDAAYSGPAGFCVGPGLPPGRGIVPLRAASLTRSTSSSLPPAAIHRGDCWWPEVIPASGMARGPTYPVAPEKIIVAAKSLFTCFRITTAHSPTSKRAGLDSGLSQSPSSTRSLLADAHLLRTPSVVRVPPRRRFDVGPRYFPGVVMVQRLRPLCLRVAPWLHRPGRVFHLPAAGLYFANKKHGSVSSSRWSPARNRLRTVLLLGDQRLHSSIKSEP